MPRGTLEVRRRKHFVRTFRAPLFQSSALAARQHQFFLLFSFTIFFLILREELRRKAGTTHSL